MKLYYLIITFKESGNQGIGDRGTDPDELDRFGKRLVEENVIESYEIAMKVEK